MYKKVRWLNLWFLILWLTACTTPVTPPAVLPPAAGPTPTHSLNPIFISSESFQGVIFPEETAERASVNLLLPDQKVQAYWTPGKDDVVRLEQGIEDYLKAQASSKYPEILPRLKEYNRQYFGVQVDNSRLVYASFFCAQNDEDNVWKQQPVWVQDGGSCFFQVEFEPTTGKFSRLQVNGEA